MYNISNYGNYLSAEYETDKDGFMVLGIPYDKGWKIIVDGTEVDYYNVNGGFIGFGINEGVHNVQMSFIPRGFKVGLVISVTGFILFIGFVTVSCIKKKRSNIV